MSHLDCGQNPLLSLRPHTRAEVDTAKCADVELVAARDTFTGQQLNDVVEYVTMSC